MQRSIIGIVGGSTSAYVIWGQNQLLQRRQFAFDGVVWFYQPTTRSRFQVVSERDVPQRVKDDMKDGLERAKAAADFKEETGKQPPWA